MTYLHLNIHFLFSLTSVGNPNKRGVFFLAGTMRSNGCKKIHHYLRMSRWQWCTRKLENESESERVVHTLLQVYLKSDSLCELFNKWLCNECLFHWNWTVYIVQKHYFSLPIFKQLMTYFTVPILKLIKNHNCYNFVPKNWIGIIHTEQSTYIFIKVYKHFWEICTSFQHQSALKTWPHIGYKRKGKNIIKWYTAMNGGCKDRSCPTLFLVHSSNWICSQKIIIFYILVRFVINLLKLKKGRTNDIN